MPHDRTLPGRTPSYFTQPTYRTEKKIQFDIITSDINKLASDISSLASQNGISIANASDVYKNDEMMNLI